MNIRNLFVLLVIMALLAASAAAAPLAAPCVPGAAYNPACDANQDGTINVADIQLTAGHWNQSGTFTSDNNHNHLGQTWTGASNPLKIQGAFGAPDYAPLVLSNSQGHGLSIPSASIDGVYVGSAGYYGMVVNAAAQDGVYIGAAGSPSSSAASTASNGFEVAGAQGSGLYVGRADGAGIVVNSAGEDGIRICRAGNVSGCPDNTPHNGIEIGNTEGDGLYVGTAQENGVNVYSLNYAGYFLGDIWVFGNCIGCRPANFAVNAGKRTLQPGDVVSVLGVTSTDFDAGSSLWQVVAAQSGQAAVGVVAGRAELVTENDQRPGQTGKRLVPRDGAAAPGDYVTIVYSGPMQVKLSADAGAIAPGQRLTAAADGAVRPLGTLKVQLADGAGTANLSEDAPALGVALDAPQDGRVWVLVTLK